MYQYLGCVAILLCFLSGCDSGMKLTPVSGKVTLDGKPLAYKTVMFISQSTELGVNGGGNTKQDGSYSVFANMPGATTDQVGLPPGKYKVMVTDPVIPIKEDTPVQSSDETDVVVAVAPDARPRKTEIPAIYTKHETSPLEVEVPAEGGTIDLVLTSKPG
jgi:hypothetical protein